jgi:hypothetical protein
MIIVYRIFIKFYNCRREKESPGALQIAKKITKNKTIVTVMPDRGERYLSSGMYK